MPGTTWNPNAAGLHPGGAGRTVPAAGAPSPAAGAPSSSPGIPAPALATLARILTRKPGGQGRPGQQAMCRAVETALSGAGHLLVEAPTGTGKSLAYLVPAVLFAVGGADRRVVVVTATKALQEQLVREDLPFLAAAFAEDGVRFSYAMLKGRSNYLCRAKLGVTLSEGVEARLDFGDGGVQAALERIRDLGAWAEETTTGDRTDIPGGTSDAVWSQVSVDAGECPGAGECHAGRSCFAEAARERAGAAEIVVVNAHLYAAHLASGGHVLPGHDAVVFDEAHTLEDIVSAAFGLRLSGARVRRVASRFRGAGGGETARRLERAAGALDEALAAAGGGEPTRVRPTEGRLAETLGFVATLGGEAAAELRRLRGGDTPHPGPGDEGRRAKVAQAARLVEGLVDDAQRLLQPASYANHVAWVEQARDRHELNLAAVEVGPILSAALYPAVTAVATSATLATGGSFDGLARRLGLTLPPPGDEGPPPFSALAVESPFDHRRQGLLYVPVHLPDPRDPGYPEAMHDELHALAAAAGGRTLALFTSRSAMERAAGALEGRGPYEVLVQDRLPRPELLARFRSGPGFALFATQGFWSGIDLPGSLCHLVVIDRLPFPRPTDPLTQARREAAAAHRLNPFAAVDVPAAATLLAQGAGRLIRTTTDRGVVAVLDRRLATARYRPALLATLPPLRRTVDRSRVLGVLAALHDDAGRTTGATTTTRATGVLE